MEFSKKRTRHYIKKIILINNLIEYKCKNCGIFEWHGKKLSLHLEHINGVNNDNRIENLCFLCPNCHSLTDTYCGKNNKSKYSIYNRKVSDETLLENMKCSKNPREALQKSEMSGAGNYNRIYKLAETYNISHMKKGFKNKITINNKKCANHKCQKEFFNKASKVKYCCSQCYQESSKKIKLSDYEIYNLYVKNNFNYSETGRQIGVSDNTVKKRIRKYNQNGEQGGNRTHNEKC